MNGRITRRREVAEVCGIASHQARASWRGGLEMRGAKRWTSYVLPPKKMEDSK